MVASAPIHHALALHLSDDATWILSLGSSGKASPARIAAVRPLMRKHSFPTVRRVWKLASSSCQSSAHNSAIASTQVVERQKCAGLAAKRVKGLWALIAVVGSLGSFDGEDRQVMLVSGTTTEEMRST